MRRVRTFCLIGLGLILVSGPRAAGSAALTDLARREGRSRIDEKPPGTLQEALEVVAGIVGGRPRRGPDTDRMNLLVELEPGADRRGILELAASSGGHCRYEYSILPQVIALRQMTPTAVERLKTMQGVLRVREERIFHVALNDSTPLVRGRQDQLLAAGISAAGTGARLCVIDTGIDPDHTMFAARIDAAAGYDFHNDDADPTDDHGHGSHVAGIALGRTGFDHDFGGGSGSEPLQGVAPLATLIGAKVLGAGGSGSESDVIAGIEHCADPALANGPADVINMSLGAGFFDTACDEDLVAQASNNAVDAGVVVVTSAGNGASLNGLSSPACASKVIAVAAAYDDDFPNPDFPDRTSFSFIPLCSDSMPRRDQLACFSNRSPRIHVAAPGCLTYSADGLDPGGSAIDGLCGTSMASPHVAGLAALLRGLDPLVPPAAVRQLVRQGAVDLGPPGFDTGYGFGRIDVIATLRRAGSCVVPVDCDDGLFCNGAESCAGGTCESGAPTCPGQRCDENADLCLACGQDADCNDGIVCNGSEVCTGGVCQPGPLACVGLCDVQSNSCVECFTDVDCDDGDFCNGVERCDGSGSCGVELIDCNDNGVQDLCDVDDGSSADVAPQNGVPDECDALVRFTVGEIPTLGGAAAQAYGINAAGHVVGAAETGELTPGGQPVSRAFLWDGATIADLGTLGGETSLAWDINDMGTIVGTADLAEPLPPPPLLGAFKNQPTRWDAGVPTRLEPLPGIGWWNGSARAISNTESIGGNLVNGYELIRGAIWTPAEPRPLEVLPQQGADMTDVWDVADAGEAVGWMNQQFLGFTRSAFLLPAGAQNPIPLATLGGNWGWALGISARGRIVGQAGTSAGLLTAAAWDSPTIVTDLGNLGGAFSLARAINDGDQIVGASTHPGSVSLSDTLAFLWDEGTLYELNDLIPRHLGWELRDAWDLNEAGQIAGIGFDRQGAERAVRLDPCGTPGTACFVSNCLSAADCDDGIFCNGAESCPAGFCVPAFPPACGDGDSCTSDYCDAQTDSCRSIAPPVPEAPAGLILGRAAGTSVAELEWDAVPGATGYNVYRATSIDLTDLACFAAGLAQPSTPDDGALAEQEGVLFYLVASLSCSGESDLGNGASGPRPNPSPCGVSRTTDHVEFDRPCITASFVANRSNTQGMTRSSRRAGRAPGRPRP